MKTAKALAVQVHGVDLRAMLPDRNAMGNRVQKFSRAANHEVLRKKREKREENVTTRLDNPYLNKVDPLPTHQSIMMP